MMDFYKIKTKTISEKEKKTGIYPSFIVGQNKDLMVQGKAFYAIWNEDTGLWSKNEFDVARIIDADIDEYKKAHTFSDDWTPVSLYMSDFSTNMWNQYKKFIAQSPDNFKQLDTKVTFANTEVKKNDYVSRRLPYVMEEGSCEAYEEMISTLYDVDQREKIEWAIGSIIFGDSKRIQKFIGLYGGPGTGKSTILNIIEALFKGYCVSFDAKELVSGTNNFAGDAFATNPLVGIQHDGDLSRINDNSLLNTIVSHEKLTINQKFKSKFEVKLNTFLFMATNEPFKITNLNSGLSRRLIDVHPSGRLVDESRYHMLMDKILNEELGHIAYHCLKVYDDLGRTYYSSYKPVDMMFKTDPFFNFVQDYIMFYPSVAQYDYITMGAAYDEFKRYRQEDEASRPMARYKFKDNLKSYFDEFIEEQHTLESGERVRSCFHGFKKEVFNIIGNTTGKKLDIEEYNWLDLKEQESIFDKDCRDCPAQYASKTEKPLVKWSKCQQTLKELDTSKIHYVKVPLNHIVIDFDLKDESGNKSLERNIEAAKKFPPTYAEISKGGSGIHLHYIYQGNPEELARVYDDNIEIKVNVGDSSLRRKLSKCNNLSVANIGIDMLPKRETKKVLDFEGFKNERALRTAIDRNLQKLNVPGTKPSVEFILKDLDKAYESGIHYDVSDLRPKIISFALNSTHQSELCLEMVSKMKFMSEDHKEDSVTSDYEELPIAIFDVEVFPNLFVLVYKLLGEENKCVVMINPERNLVKDFIEHYCIVGFNNRGYDNHIIYAWIQGYSNLELYNLSQRIINNEKNSKITSAYNISYTDIYDYTTTKQSLKKWEIELGINHLELGLPWDKPVDKKLWDKVAEYCCNDVIATEAVGNATQSDFVAREILADLTDGTVNMTTNTLITKLLFGDDNDPELIYTDLTTGNQYGRNNVLIGNDSKNKFPEYNYIPGPENKGRGRNMFRGIDLGFGGYVFAVPGMYSNVALLDVQNMHGASIEALNLFAEHTKNYADLRTTRNCIKVGDFETPKHMFDGKLTKYLENEEQAGDLSGALKLPCNQTYGLTQTPYPNPAKDERNVNNIVALRGAIFMKMLQDELEKKGFPVISIRTDSCKIPGATPEIIKFVQDYALKFGYVMEHECTYEKMCLVNDAVYIAKYDDKGIRNKGGKKAGKWTATGTQFAVPYVFKTLFSHEPIEFSDFCETKSVTGGALYLDMNEDLPDVEFFERCKETRGKIDRGVKITQKALKELDEIANMSEEELDNEIAKGHNYQFIGKVDSFVPIKIGCGGGVLYRYDGNKYQAPPGTKGYRWQEAEIVRQLHKDDCIDKLYYTALVDDAVKSISQYGDFEWFVS